MARCGRIRRLAVAAVLLGVLCAPGIAMGAGTGVASKALTTYRTCILTANPSTSTVAIDTYVDQASATSNFGTATTLSIQSRNSSRNRRTFVDFDLTKCSPAIPSSATVSNGTLRLYVSILPGSCSTYDAYRVTGSQWGESTLTWNTAPATAASATASATAGPSPCGVTAAGYVSWDVTADAALFVAGTSNFGWMIRDRTEDSVTARTATLSAKNLGTLAQSPQLVVTWKT